MGVQSRGWAGVAVLAAMASGCLLQPGGGRSSSIPIDSDGGVVVVSDAGAPVGSDAGPPIDPRPPEERACPRGGVLTLQLWQVYATPRQPDGSVWDGLSSGTRELLCGIAGRALRQAVRLGLNEWVPGSGATFDRYAGSTFQRIVAEQCGVGANWLQERYEGPDLFALGSTTGASPFQTLAEQDTWQAPRAARTPWSTAIWRAPCGDASTNLTFEVKDEDLAFDDQVERATTFRAGDIPPGAICSGWGWLDGADGLVGSLFRLDVSGGQQACEGIFADSFEELVIPVADRSSTIPTPTSARSRPEVPSDQ